MSRFLDLTGLKFGRLTVLERAENGKDNRARWLCQCDCGNTKIVSRSHLRSGAVKSCGCLNSPDLTGKVFGRLTVIERVEDDKPGSYYRCKCACGNETVVRASFLNAGTIKSCGCYKYEVQCSKHKENKYTIDGDIVTMYTTNGLAFIFDSEDLEKVLKYTWQGYQGNYIASMRKEGDKRHIIHLHRYVLGVTNPNETVDHISGDPTDNRKENLRICTQAQNTRNRKYIGNSSGVTGVYLEPDGKWRAKITYNGEIIHLGRFETLREAAEARWVAEDKYFGDFGRRKSRGE